MASRANLKRLAPEKEHDAQRKRRRRTAFTNEQLNRLEESFEEERFPGIQIREKLARELNIGEGRIQVWFQNRRSRWRKSLKNKPAKDLRNDVSISTMFQPSLASFQLPMHPTPFSSREPFFPPFTTSPSFIPFYENMAPVASQGSQTVSVMLGPRVSASVIPPFSCSASLPCSYREQFQTSCLKERYSPDDYLAAVTLASGFQREN
ncbi:retinal homeobox protein Rx-B-like [Porites lutea]|uniref:retinal homeobox protein Rx-B-like n=1 Tax=Porites lutea TaxID=51062 RepID=UPI003CC60B02